MPEVSLPTSPPLHAPRPQRTPSVLLTLYGVFALAAGARAAVQLATRAGEAPVAHWLSAGAAVIYLSSSVALRVNSAKGRRAAGVLAGVELAGVVTVGTLSLAVPEWFADASVWSGFGIGYAFVPLVLPVVTLVWLARTSLPRPARRASNGHARRGRGASGGR